MKNLRKVLSLILVVAMAASFMVFASAKDYKTFTDKADIKDEYLEAIDVITALGIFAGDETNALNPQGYFTRAQAAKIVTYMSIGAGAAERLTPAGGIFTDVPATHWASKFIAYAYEKGILGGDGDGKFRPEDYVTGAEVAKLMNTVLGYGKMGEYVGASWQLNAISDGVARGLITGDADLSAPALREAVIQYVFNTINPDSNRNYYVEYSSIVGAYVRADGNSQWSLGTIGKTTIGKYIFNLISEYSANPNGDPARKWRVGNKYITELHDLDAPTVTSMDGTSVTNMTDATGAFAVFYYKGYPLIEKSPDGGTTDYYVNGKVATKAEADTASAKKGAIVKMFTDGIYVYHVAIIEKKVATVAAPPVYSYGAVSSIPGATITGQASITGDLDLVRDDVILFYLDGKNVCHVEKAEAIEAQLKTFSSSGGGTATFTDKAHGVSGLDGAENKLLYTAAVAASGSTAAKPATGTLLDSANYDVDSVIYVDNGGNIVKFEPGKGIPKAYAFVTAFSDDGFGSGVTKARMIKADGTYITANIKAVYTSTVGSTTLAGVVAGDADAGWYTYTEKDGLYTLKQIAAGRVVSNTLDASQEENLSPATPYYSITSGFVPATNPYYFNGSTIFVLFNGAEIKQVVGIQNLPKIKLEGDNGDYIVAVKGDTTATANVAQVVFIYTQDKGAATQRDIAFFGYLTLGKQGQLFYTSSFILNGALMDDRTYFDAEPQTGAFEYIKDADGVYTKVTPVDLVTVSPTAVAVEYSDGNIIFGGSLATAKRLATDAKIFVYDSGTYVTSDNSAAPQLINTPSSIGTTQYYKAWYVLSSATSGVNNGAIGQLYLVKDDAAAKNAVFGDVDAILDASATVTYREVAFMGVLKYLDTQATGTLTVADAKTFAKNTIDAVLTAGSSAAATYSVKSISDLKASGEVIDSPSDGYTDDAHTGAYYDVVIQIKFADGSTVEATYYATVAKPT